MMLLKLTYYNFFNRARENTGFKQLWLVWFDQLKKNILKQMLASWPCLTASLKGNQDKYYVG